MLTSMLIKRGRSHLTTPPPLKFLVLAPQWEGFREGEASHAELPLPGSADLHFRVQTKWEKSIVLVPVTIVEMFASHVPRRMQILRSGDGLEGHFRTIF